MPGQAQRVRRARAQAAAEALRTSGYESISSFVEDLLYFDMLPFEDCRSMALALLEKEEPQSKPVQDVNFRQLLCKYLSTVADEEMNALVAEPALRLPVNAVNPDTHTISLCMLSYARNERSNILQVTAGYWAYADNATKRMIEILHRMGLLITYETIRQAFKSNAKAVSAALEKKAWSWWFFVSFDNMNFYEHRRDQRMHNKGAQVAYTTGYVCFMRSEIDNVPDAVWEDTYLDADQVDYAAVNSLKSRDFQFNGDAKHHRSPSVRYLLSKILAATFPVAVSKQRKILRDGRALPNYEKLKAPLRETQCPLEKADLLPLPILALDESSIDGTIKILKEYLERLGLEDAVVQNKKIMFRGDFLTVRNVTNAIYRRQVEVAPIHKYQFIEPIAGFLHLQMNVLKLFLCASICPHS